MANKDITATVIANILNLIKTASDFATATVKESRQYKTAIREVEKSSGISITPEPRKFTNALQTWFNIYIKPGSTSAGTATVSSKFTTTAQWRTDFFNTRTQLLANASSEAIAELDKLFLRYTSYNLKYRSTRR